MPFIENCAEYQIVEGKHIEAGEDAILIQITDPDREHPKPLNSFKEIYKFSFLDIEDEEHPHSFNDHQAIEISKILKKAIEEDKNVIVHCVMGLCRSGAVVDVGVTMGFKETGKWRTPNILVKQKLFKYVFNY
jgi:protein tyrosine phosphatase